jgi:hypothetical protein
MTGMAEDEKKMGVNTMLAEQFIIVKSWTDRISMQTIHFQFLGISYKVTLPLSLSSNSFSHRITRPKRTPF